jgi:hypothetical protein
LGGRLHPRGLSLISPRVRHILGTGRTGVRGGEGGRDALYWWGGPAEKSGPTWQFYYGTALAAWSRFEGWFAASVDVTTDVTNVECATCCEPDTPNHFVCGQDLATLQVRFSKRLRTMPGSRHSRLTVKILFSFTRARTHGPFIRLEQRDPVGQAPAGADGPGRLGRVRGAPRSAHLCLVPHQ